MENLLIASIEQIKKLNIGDIIIVNVNDGISDFAIFLRYDEKENKIICIDCILNDKNGKIYPNISEYDYCYIIDNKKISEEGLMSIIDRI